MVRPVDPNDIIGPAGFGSAGFVQPAQTFAYTIRYENQATANAPAQVVRIVQQLDPDLDFRAFQLGDFGIGELTFTVPEGRIFYSTRLDLRRLRGVFVEVVARFDVVSGLATWTFTSLDPETLDVPANPLVGFLPPNRRAPEGEGFVKYTVRPRAGGGTGTRIDALARIFFDNEKAVVTPPIFNTLDAGAPTAQVAPLRPVQSKRTFVVRWSGTDDQGGSGVATYDVYFAVDDGPWQPWLSGTTDTSALFRGNRGRRYAFAAVATDNVGNRQPGPGQPQVTTYIEMPRPAGPLIPLPVPVRRGTGPGTDPGSGPGDGADRPPPPPWEGMLQPEPLAFKVLPPAPLPEAFPAPAPLPADGPTADAPVLFADLALPQTEPEFMDPTWAVPAPLWSGLSPVDLVFALLTPNSRRDEF